MSGAKFDMGNAGGVGEALADRAETLSGTAALVGCQDTNTPFVHCRRTALSAVFVLAGVCPAQLSAHVAATNAQRTAAVSDWVYWRPTMHLV